MPRQTGSSPFLMVTFAIAVLCVMDALVKAVAQYVPLGQVVVLRYTFGTLAALPVFLMSRPTLSWRSFKANAMRAVVVCATATCFFHGIAVLPLAEALALSFLSPIFFAIFGGLLLGERVTPAIVGAIALGFVGVMVILWNKLSGGLAADLKTLSGVVAILLSAVLYALAMVLLRKQAAFDTAPVLVFLQSAVAAVVASPALVIGETVRLDGQTLGMFALIGLLGAIGHFAMAWGYARAEATRLGTLEYTGFVWAAVLGYAFFSEPLAPETVAGAALIVSACLLAARGRRVARIQEEPA